MKIITEPNTQTTIHHIISKLFISFKKFNIKYILYNYYLYRIKEFKTKELNLPDPLHEEEEIDIKKVESKYKYPKPYGYLPFKEEE